jgi:hypothetical protein
LSRRARVALTALTGGSTTEPLTSSSNIPVYLIPTETTMFDIAGRTTGSVPIQFDSESPAGDPDIASTVGRSVTASLTANPIAQGIWDVAPVDVGAFRAKPAPTEPVATSALAFTRAFDPAISSPTGDLWSASTDPSTLDSFDPVTVSPGQTATIPIAVTPAGRAGTHVRGTLFLDDANFILFDSFVEPNGNEVAAIPYRYTIK